MQGARLDEAQTGIKITGRAINNLRYGDYTIFMAEREEELESLLMKVKEGSEKAGWKQHSKNEDHGIRYHHFMANRWGNNENSDRLYFLGLQNHCRWWLQPWNQKMLTAWKKSYNKHRQYIKKQSHHIANKVSSSQSNGLFSSHVWCESWNIKNAECRRIDPFELCCWRRLLWVTCTARRSNQFILKEIIPEYSLEELMLKPKCPYFSHLMWRAESLEKTFILGKIEGRRSRGWQRMRWVDGFTDSMGISLSKLWEMVKDRKPWHAAFQKVVKGQTRLSDCTTTAYSVHGLEDSILLIFQSFSTWYVQYFPKVPLNYIVNIKKVILKFIWKWFKIINLREEWNGKTHDTWIQNLL